VTDDPGLLRPGRE